MKITSAQKVQYDPQTDTREAIGSRTRHRWVLAQIAKYGVVVGDPLTGWSPDTHLMAVARGDRLPTSEEEYAVQGYWHVAVA